MCILSNFSVVSRKNLDRNFCYKGNIDIIIKNVLRAPPWGYILLILSGFTYLHLQRFVTLIEDLFIRLIGVACLVRGKRSVSMPRLGIKSERSASLTTHALGIHINVAIFAGQSESYLPVVLVECITSQCRGSGIS